MANCLYKLYEELGKIGVPDRYTVSFEFSKKNAIGRTGFIIIEVRDNETGYKTKWAVSPNELEENKLDYIADHIWAMIENMEDE